MIVKRDGFDAFVGNPPFLGGRRMRGSLGDKVFNYISNFWPHASMNADFCSFFYLRAASILRDTGTFWPAPQQKHRPRGHSKNWSLLHGRQFENKFVHALSSFTWPGTASVVSALVIGRKGPWHGVRVLDGRQVQAISPVLDDAGAWGEAKPLPQNLDRSFQGSVLVGMGFVLTEDQAQSFIDCREADDVVIHPYLSGDDLNTHPDQRASRWAIDFRDYDLETCPVKLA